MQLFRITLSNNGTVAGAHSIPPSSASVSKDRPLIVALHGGTYDHRYFDATPRYSASLISDALGVPFVTIDRPSYGGTSSILPIPEDSTFPEETGISLHRYILPKLWSEFGIPNQCNCIVLLCHSLGVTGGVVAASLHSQDVDSLYPLGGIIASGMGDKQSEAFKSSGGSVTSQLVGADHILNAVDAKDALMFKPGTAPPEVLEQSQCLNVAAPLAEITQFAAKWFLVWKQKWAVHVRVPVMFSLVDDDPFSVSTKKEVECCVRAFENSIRVDGNLIMGAPHCMELSHWSQGWYARCFGFALECSASFSSMAQGSSI